MRPIDSNTKTQLNTHLSKIETILDCDLLAIASPIVFGLDAIVKNALEMLSDKKARLCVILHTFGGTAEVVERMVLCIRHHYKEVFFIIPDRAMSAGTIFAASGDRIYMSYFSLLGPIDPQVEKDGKLVPALSYLNQYQRLCEKANAGDLNTAEYALLTKLDLGELHRFEQAKELSIDLLEHWLSSYKFKDWKKKETSGVEVTEEIKRAQAKKIGSLLSDNERWRTHSRGISRDTLSSDAIGLKIDKIEDTPGLASAVDDYFLLLEDHMSRQNYSSFVHTREYF